MFFRGKFFISILRILKWEFFCERSQFFSFNFFSFFVLITILYVWKNCKITFICRFTLNWKPSSFFLNFFLVVTLNSTYLFTIFVQRQKYFVDIFVGNCPRTQLSDCPPTLKLNLTLTETTALTGVQFSSEGNRIPSFLTLRRLKKFNSLFVQSHCYVLFETHVFLLLGVRL